MPRAMEADEPPEELDGCYPPGDRFLNIDQEPAIWERLDACLNMDYISINELVSQNNLRLQEYWARTLASGGDIGDVFLRRIDECVNDARHSFFVGNHVRDVKETAEPRNNPAGISFGDRRKAQAIRNRAAYFTAKNLIDIAEHVRDETLQIDAVDWLRSIGKPLPPPPPHQGTPIIPGEFAGFPILGPRASPKTTAPSIPMADITQTPVKPSPSRHKRYKASMDSPGFHLPPTQLTRSTSEAGSLGTQTAPRNPNPDFSFPALSRVKQSTSEAAGLGTGTASRIPNPDFSFPVLPGIKEASACVADVQNTMATPKRYAQNTIDNQKRYGTWADLEHNIPKSISIPYMEMAPMTPRQRKMLEDHRARSVKKPYVALAERDGSAVEQKVSTHVLLARSRTDAFSPKKLDTERMPSLFTPMKQSSTPARPRKDSVGQTTSFYYAESGPSTPIGNASKAELFTPTKKSSEYMQTKHSRQQSVDGQSKHDIGPPKFYTHKRSNAMSLSSPRPHEFPPMHSTDSDKENTHTTESSMEKLDERPSKVSTFTYTPEHENALMSGGFIPQPPPVPEKSPLRTVHPLQGPQYDEHKLKRVKSQHDLSPKKAVSFEAQHSLSPETEKSADTIERREGHRIAKSVTSFNLNATAVVNTSTMQRSETVPGNLQQAAANVLEVPYEWALDFMEAAEQGTPADKPSEVGYRDTLQMKKDTAIAKKLSKLKPIAEGDESPSKKNRVVDSAQMFSSSFWNRDSTSSPSKKDRAASPTKAETTKDMKEKKEKTFAEKKPFLKAMWENMSRKVHKSKPSVPFVSVSGPTGLAPSSFMISCEPSFQAILYAQLELLLSTLANRFLMEEYNASRITRTQATNYVSRWVAMGRAQFTEFNCGQTFQGQIVWELRDQLMFFGTYDQRLRDATVSTWLVNAKEMSIKTGCIGDSAMQKHLQDSWKVLELLGGSWDDFEALSKLHIGFHDEVVKAKKRNDAAGIPHEWNPEPVPQTPAIGTLIRTPMLK